MNHASSIFLASIMALLLLLSCKTVHVTPEQYEASKIYFGNGGGFTGRLNEFCMLDNGEVYKVNPSTRKATLRNTISKSVTKSLFKKIKKANLQQYLYSEPGNMFCWMKHHSPQDTTYLIWSKNDTTTNTNVTDIYKQLVAMSKHAQQ
jgi:hypothetical protein